MSADSAVEERKAWATRHIARASDVPIYGSPEWLALPDSLEKWVAVLRFAEGSLSALEDEFSLLKPGHRGLYAEAKQATDAEYSRQREEWREEWSRKSWRPHPANRRLGHGGQPPVGEVA